MALKPPLSSPRLIQLSVQCLPSVHDQLLLWPSAQISSKKSRALVFPIVVKQLFPASSTERVVRCLTKSTEENQSSWSESEELGPSDDDGDRQAREDNINNNNVRQNQSTVASNDYPPLGIREPVYEVVEVRSDGTVSTRKINRRQLLKSSGLRPRDIRSIDPSLFLTNSMPSLLVREHAILLNLGSLRAMAMQERVLIFDYHRRGGQAFLDKLLPRLNPKNMNGGPSMPFELEVVEAALLSRVQRLERRLMDLEPRVENLLEVLPNRLNADVLEQLRISKQHLVELGSRAGALRQMLLDLLEDPHEIRRISIMGRNCTLKKGDENVECSVPLEKEYAEDEEEEIEMLLENYLQRCESCHGQSERLLDSAKEMEDSIAVNLSSRRLEVSRVELLLQVGAFCVGVGALIAGIFGMNLRSFLEEHVSEEWEWLGRSLVGHVKYPESAEDLASKLIAEVPFKVSLTMISAVMMLITFENREDCVSVIKEGAPWLAECFDNADLWSPSVICNEKFIRIRVEGIPLHAWNNDFFENLCEQWGKLIKVDRETQERDRLDCCHFIVRMNYLKEIESSIEAVIDGSIFKLRITKEDQVYIKPLFLKKSNFAVKIGEKGDENNFIQGQGITLSEDSFVPDSQPNKEGTVQLQNSDMAFEKPLSPAPNNQSDHENLADNQENSLRDLTQEIVSAKNPLSIEDNINSIMKIHEPTKVQGGKKFKVAATKVTAAGARRSTRATKSKYRKARFDLGGLTVENCAQIKAPILAEDVLSTGLQLGIELEGSISAATVDIHNFLVAEATRNNL